MVVRVVSTSVAARQVQSPAEVAGASRRPARRPVSRRVVACVTAVIDAAIIAVPSDDAVKQSLQLVRGGGQEHRRRAGTENLPGIAGFAAAATAAAAELAVYGTVAALRDGLETEIAATAPEALVLGAAAPRLPNTSAIAMPGVAAETQVVALDLDGVMVSAGAACSSGKVGPSHVLAAMRVDPEIAASTIRVSLGWRSTEAEIDHFLRAWTALYRRCRGLAEGARAA